MDRIYEYPPRNNSRASALIQESREAVFMSTTYAIMSVGVLVTSTTAWLVGSNPEAMAAFRENAVLAWTTLLVPFGIAIFLPARLRDMSPLGAVFWYAIFTGLLGVWLSGIAAKAVEDPTFAVDLAASFLTTVGMFIGLALWGWTTKRNLQGVGLFFGAALWGLILAGIVNAYLQNSMMDFGLSAAGVVIFSGLIAADVQEGRRLARDGGFGASVLVALMLYLDFINLLLHLLKLMGHKKD
jgi:FtsH-binding integral membrane protein